MKRLLISVVFATSLAFTSCQFDDSDIWDKLDEYGESINDHEERISSLEELCKHINTNISALQVLIEALEKQDYITNILPVRKDGEDIGYAISFAYSGTITIYHGSNGKDGIDGNDGYTPQIGVAQDTDGKYYWTLNGEWLLDANGNKIKASGTEGKDGQDGTDGSNGVTPRLKIENDYWYVSYDNGASWEQLGKATGEDGKNGQDGANSIIIGIEECETEVVFILSDNTTITIPKNTKTSLVDPNDICSAMDDVKFMEYCYQNFDVNKDGKVSPVEAKSVRTINIDDLEIYSIKGIEYFEILETLTAKNTFLRNVDISFNNKLISFAFTACSSLTSIVLPESFSLIAEKAFYGCSELRSITIHTGITAVGNSAFSGCCSLTSVHYSSDLSAWCKIDFANNTANPLCNTAKLYIKGVETTEITIPSDITEIKNYTFYGCNSLTSVIVPDNVASIGSSAFSGCTGELVINSKVVETDRTYSYDTSSDSWLFDSKFTKLTIGDNITKIGDYAFKGCNLLTSVTVPDNVTSIGSSAFSGSTGELIINSKVVETDRTSSYHNNGTSWLFDSEFTKLTIGDNITKIGDYAFSGCSKLTSLTIGDSVTTIGNYAFSGCRKLTSIAIPDSVTSIGYCAFSGCAGELIINSKVVETDNYPLEYPMFDGWLKDSKFTKLTIGDSITTIGEYAFCECSSFTSVTIGDSVTKIGSDAFYKCTSLESVTIGDSVTKIGRYAFYQCTSLESVYCKAITPPVGAADMFLSNASGRTIYVPLNSVEAYKSDEGWKVYANNIVGYDF